MEDLEIIDLYFKRDERAISEAEAKYGVILHGIALNFLSHADAEECVKDAYLQAWDAIPPLRPLNIGVWLGREVRNIAVNLWNKNHLQKQYAGIEQLLNELESCIPSAQTAEQKSEEKKLTEVINQWLSGLSQNDRVLFLRRYWSGAAVKELSKEFGISDNRMTKRFFRLRQKLKSKLKQAGNETSVNELYNSITNVKVEYLEELFWYTTAGRRKFRRPFIMAVSIIALLLVGCGIVTALFGDSIQNWFANSWEVITGESMGSEHRTDIDSLNQRIGLSQTVDDVTVTVDSATVGDDNFFLLLRVDGINASKRKIYDFEVVESFLDMNPVNPLTFGARYLGVDDNGALLILLGYNLYPNYFLTNPTTVSLQLGNLFADSGNKRKVVAQGQWSFDFELDCSLPVDIIYLEDTNVDFYDYVSDKKYSDSVSDIVITTTGIKFIGCTSITVGVDIYAVLQNGNVVICNDGIGIPYEDGNWHYSGQWEVPINLGEIEVIRIGKTDIPVK